MSLRTVPRITDIRGCGLLAAFDVEGHGMDAQKRLFAAGLHVKFTGQSGILAPAFVADKSLIDEIIAIIRSTLAVS